MTDIEALRARMREAYERVEVALPGMVWTAHMDRLHLIASPEGSTCISDEVTLALCATGDHAFRVLPYLALASPANVKALDAEITRLREELDRVTRERDEARADAASWQAQAQRVAQDAVEFGTRAEAAEAALAKRDEEVARLRAALEPFARVGQRPMFDDERSYTPRRDDYERARLALTQEPTNAER